MNNNSKELNDNNIKSRFNFDVFVIQNIIKDCNFFSVVYLNKDKAIFIEFIINVYIKMLLFNNNIYFFAIIVNIFVVFLFNFVAFLLGIIWVFVVFFAIFRFSFFCNFAIFLTNTFSLLLFSLLFVFSTSFYLSFFYQYNLNLDWFFKFVFVVFL